MESSIRRLEPRPAPQAVSPRGGRRDEGPPFDLSEEDRRPARSASPEPKAAAHERLIAPPAEDEVGAHLDLSA
jgi:hypothetical protein